MTLLIISGVVAVIIYIGIFWSIQRQNKMVVQWIQLLNELQQSVELDLQRIPLEFKEDEAWGQASRTFGQEFSVKLRNMISHGSIGDQAYDRLAQPTPLLLEQSIKYLNDPNPVMSHLRERLSLLQELVTFHYPFLSSANRNETYEIKHRMFNETVWSFYWGVPTLLTLVAGLVSYSLSWQTSQVIIIWTSTSTLIYLVLSLALWWYKNRSFRQETILFQYVNRLEHFATIPFQDRVQMDMTISLMEGISHHSQNLSGSINSHKDAIDAIPTNISNQVSTQVRDGLTPVSIEIGQLREQLSTSYNDMAKALNWTAGQFVMLIDRVGDFEEYQKWSSNLATTSTSMTALTHTLTEYQIQTEEIYQDLKKLTEDIHSNQERIQESYTAIANSIYARTAEEETARTLLSEIVHEQTQMITSEQVQIRSAIDKLQVQVRESRQLYQKITDSFPELVHGITSATNRLNNIADTVMRIPEQYQDALKAMRIQSEKHIEHLATQLNIYEEQYQNKYHETLETLQQQMSAYTNRMDTQLRIYENQHRTYLDTVEQQGQSVQKIQDNFLKTLTSQTRQQLEQLSDQLNTQVRDYKNQHQSYLDEVERQTQQAVKTQQQSLQELTDEVGTYLQQLKKQTEHYEEIVEAIYGFSEKLQRPEHPIVKPAFFIILILILSSLIILVVRGFGLGI